MTATLVVSLDGITALPKGHVATVKTYLEMRAAPALAAPLPPEHHTLRRLGAAGEPEYRAIFRQLGERWLWWSRLLLNAQELSAVIGNPDVQAFAVQKNGATIGLLELDFRDPDAAELAFLGLFEGHTGAGTGNWLMQEVLMLAWSRPIERLFVHTCTFDHPNALGFYRRWGFESVKQAIEIVPDPRKAGLLPSSAAPHVPMC